MKFIGSLSKYVTPHQSPPRHEKKLSEQLKEERIRLFGTDENDYKKKRTATVLPMVKLPKRNRDFEWSSDEEIEKDALVILRYCGMEDEMLVAMKNSSFVSHEIEEIVWRFQPKMKGRFPRHITREIVYWRTLVMYILFTCYNHHQTRIAEYFCAWRDIKGTANKVMKLWFSQSEEKEKTFLEVYDHFVELTGKEYL